MIDTSTLDALRRAATADAQQVIALRRQSADCPEPVTPQR